MRVSSKRLCCLIVFLHSICNSFAYDAEVDGVYYNFSGTTAEVTSGDSKYTGSVVIPEYEFVETENDSDIEDDDTEEDEEDQED